MKLEEATAELRPRGAWEAVDLGCALARRHYGPLMRGWLTVALPLWAIILLCFHWSPHWTLFFLVWTKPVLTRQPVFFMSRVLFGQPPGWREFWSHWRINFRDILGALTFKRFSTQRPFRLPIIMLEGQSGNAYTQRATVLSAHGGGSAGGLTFIAQMLELSVTAAVAWGLFKGMSILDSQWDNGLLRVMTADTGTELPPRTLWFITAACAAAIAVVEPFYGAAGFALYINSRTHLEGWDIEVAFRRMSARLAPGAVIASAVLLLFVFAGTAPRAVAADNKREAKESVEEILKSPDFELNKVEVLVRKVKEKARPDSDYSLRGSGGGAAFGLIGYAIIAAVIIGLAVLLWMNRDSLRGRGGVEEEKRAGPRVVMGMDLAPESLPEDIPQVAWREYMAGRHLEALRLLYRGALAWLVNRAGVPVHESDTEGDCLRHSAILPDTQRVSFFSNLTAAWVNCAYADLPPAADPMKRLCDHWPFSLRQPAAAATPDISNGATASASAWLVLPLAALLCSGCNRNNSDYETKEVVEGYKGAARTNPWLAAQRFLTESGTPAETRTILGEMPGWDATLFLPLDAVASRGEARSMLQWVAQGGHLIIACSGTSRFHNDFDDDDDDDDNSERVHMDWEAPLLKELHVRESDEADPETGKIKFGRTSYSLKSYNDDNDILLDLQWHTPDVVAGDRHAASVASFDQGMGRITLLASATPFRNRYIADNDHAAILENIVALQPSSLVIFVSRGEITLWDMLKRHAWMPVTASILLIILWLWRHLPRFGRAQPANESGIRHFGSQLDEAGHFLSERAGPAALLAPARRAVLTAAAHRGLHPDAPDFMDHLAARSGLTHAEISAALLDSTDKNLTAATAALQKLQQSIGPLH